MVNKDYRFPVSEIYGPVAQGEGALIGLPTIFLRLGGCDYRCRWCDSLYAVLPQYRHTWERLTVETIMARLSALNTAVRHVTLSGGNPAIHPAGPLVRALKDAGYRVAVETQGTLAADWLSTVDSITVSPKPPSSGNVTDAAVLSAFLDGCGDAYYKDNRITMKMVVFNDDDYEYARIMHRWFPELSCYLQVGTSQDAETFSAQKLLEDLATLQQRALEDKEMSTVRVLPQLHAVLHGLKRGI